MEFFGKLDPVSQLYGTGGECLIGFMQLSLTKDKKGICNFIIKRYYYNF